MPIHFGRDLLNIMGSDLDSYDMGVEIGEMINSRIKSEICNRKNKLLYVRSKFVSKAFKMR